MTSKLTMMSKTGAHINDEVGILVKTLIRKIQKGRTLLFSMSWPESQLTYITVYTDTVYTIYFISFSQTKRSERKMP